MDQYVCLFLSRVVVRTIERDVVRLVVAGQGLHLEKEMDDSQTKMEDKFSRARDRTDTDRR